MKRLTTHFCRLSILLVVLASANTVKAQNTKTVTISGIVFCEDSIMGTLSDVNIFNQNRSTGSITNESGEFSIQIGQNDTLIFSTVQHEDELFYFKENEPFEDMVISVPMKMDIIWVDVVSVIGKGNYEEFKRELLGMDMPDYNPSMALPIVNRYAEEYSTGEGAIKIHGPLTYLSKKIRQLKRRKTQTQSK